MLSSEIDRIIGMLFFFLEHTGELHIIILSRRKKGKELQYNKESLTTDHP
jgi:hypothetical protein